MTAPLGPGTPGRRRLEPVSHRADVRPRYGRIAVLTASLATTAVAVLGGVGVLPSATGDSGDSAESARDDAAQVAADVARDTPTAAPDNGSVETDAPAADEPDTSADTDGDGDSGAVDGSDDDVALPAASGDGRRVVFSESLQRVWLVDDGDDVVRTYLVSGSAEDNLDPGTYEVYSRSMDAIGIDDSGTMKFFVRFTQGDTGAAIGFHDIPIDDGAKVQTAAQLGTPLSHGCIRQLRSDAKKLWRFAPLGTEVVVTA